MKKVILLLMLSFIYNSSSLAIAPKTESIQEQKDENNFAALCGLWDELEKKVRDSRLSKEDAQRSLNITLPQLKAHLIDRYGSKEFISPKFHFPVMSGVLSDIGGVHGSGYKPVGYDFFEGNRHQGHPGHDIFVREKKNGTPAVSMASSIVLSMYDHWQQGSSLRGGNYVWLYNPVMDMLFYYAHLDKIFVRQGDFAKKGEAIAMIGRTGKNAFRKESPTHLHLMVLKYTGSELVLYDFYPTLK